MKQKQTHDFLSRIMPIEVYLLLKESAKNYQRSKTQEAIVAIIILFTAWLFIIIE